MLRTFATFGALFGFLGVLAGTFGAHRLKGRLDEELLAIYELGVRYQMFHALALLAAAWMCARWPGRLPRAAGWLLVLGHVLFCGSLYALALSGARWLGIITPAGGLCFLIAWALLAVAPWRKA